MDSALAEFVYVDHVTSVGQRKKHSIGITTMSPHTGRGSCMTYVLRIARISNVENVM